MSRRRRSEDEHENLERWLVSYADFITLLFAFFVVMYSISSINEGKYRVLSESLAAVFTHGKGESAARTMEPIQVGEAKKSDNLINLLPASTPAPEIERQDALQAEQAQLQSVADQIEAVLSPYIQDDLVTVKRDQLWIELEMKSGLFFSSGSAALSKDSLAMLYRLSEIFGHINNAIHVEGHTDNVPISTAEFPSNWALSSARAASVVKQLMDNGIDPRRMVAIGYGEYHPVADNRTEEGRNKNRRVVIIVMSDKAARYKLTADDRNAEAVPVNKSGETSGAQQQSREIKKP
jgi:chemotaxis protein MotB